MKEKDIARFWSKVDRRRPEYCWNWQASLHPFGYGRASFGGKLLGAHRVAWEISRGPVPDGAHVLHRCDNPSCCNPVHLFIGTQFTNNLDAMRKGRLDNRGSRHGMAKLSERDVSAIRGLVLWSGFTREEVAGEYGVTKETVRNIVTFRNWRHVPFAGIHR